MKGTALVALISVTLAFEPSGAQQPRPDSSATRADYKDLSDLLAHLPEVARPAFAEQHALWLGTLPFACIDRMQLPAGRGGGNRGAAPVADTSAGRAAAPGDSAGRAGAAGGRANSSGSDYFWVTTYQLIPDHKKTRAFWGCSDWHSAVSSIWVTARLARDHPGLGLRELAREKLGDHLGATNLAGELAFFRTAAGNFERPYGYAWLLKLQADLRAWPDTQAKKWATNIAPLAAWMADSLSAHLNALKQPVRAGTQVNTALVLNLALDYGTASEHTRLHNAIVSAARRLYLADKKCDTQAESAANAARAGGPGRGGRAAADSVSRAVAPTDTANRTGGAGRGGAPTPAQGGNDILSPCLSEAAIMARVLPQAAFVGWLDAFLPPLQSGRFAPLTEAPGATATGNDRVRFSALAFNRAIALEQIARALPAGDPRVPVLRRLSAIHADRGFQLLRNDTMGTNWLPAFALLYLTSRS